ncbi:hypothetical protein ACFQ8O_26460 [Streptomyces coelicoflavus]|uniref:hypothetical protein n=1 Tax=Streptomyces coelicoflavus TaxID=285562 RepID=UPI0036951230
MALTPTAVRTSLKRHTAAQAPANTTLEDREQPGETSDERPVLSREAARLKGDLATLYTKATENP